MFIESPSNPTVKALHSLTSSRERKKSGLFLVEGVRAVSDAVAAGERPYSCIFAPPLLERTNEGRALLGRLERLLRERSGGIAEASEKAVAAAGDTVHTQGIVASFKMPAWQLTEVTTASPLVLICDDIRDPGNLGTILRTAEAAGVRAVWFSMGCVDVFSPKVVRSAMGAHFRLPVFPDRSWQQLGDELGSRKIERVFAAESAASASYDTVDWTLPAALIISNEAHGLSDEAATFVRERGRMISIPMQGGTESLNAAMACAVILFEAARQRRLAHRNTAREK